MRVILLRHGDAIQSLIDRARPLSALGKEQAQNMGWSLDEMEFCPRMIWHSPKLRAVQTAAIVADVLDGAAEPVEQDGLLPNDAIEPVYELLLEAEEDVLVVGHLPFLQDLADELLAGGGQRAPGMGCGCALVLCREGEGWALERVLSG